MGTGGRETLIWLQLSTLYPLKNLSGFGRAILELAWPWISTLNMVNLPALVWSFPRAVLLEELEACMSPCGLQMSGGNWDGVGNDLESSSILRCWWQLYLDPKRQVDHCYANNTHTGNFYSCQNGPGLSSLLGQCFRISGCHCLTSNSLPQVLAVDCMPAGRLGFGLRKWALGARAV